MQGSNAFQSRMCYNFFMFIKNVLVIALSVWHTIREFRRTWQICPYWQRLQMIHYVRTSPQLPWQCDRWRISAPATACTGTLWKGQIESIVPILAGPTQSWKWESVQNIESVGSQPWPGLSWCPQHDDLCQKRWKIQWHTYCIWSCDNNSGIASALVLTQQFRKSTEYPHIVWNRSFTYCPSQPQHRVT